MKKTLLLLCLFLIHKLLVAQANPVIVLSQTSICNDTVTLTAPNGYNAYSWSGPGIIGTNITQSIQANASGTYSVTLTPVSGPIVTIDTTVLNGPSINVIGNNYQTVCSGQQVSPITFSATPSANLFTWTNSNTSIGLAASGTSSSGNMTGGINGFSASTVSSQQTSIITVSVTSANCPGVTTTQAIYTITVNPLPTVAVNYSVQCNGGIYDGTLTATGANTYTWSPGGNTGSTFTASPIAQSYTVVATSTNNCVNTNTIAIPQAVSIITTYTPGTFGMPQPGPNLDLCSYPPLAVTYSASGGLTYTWSTGATTTSITASPTVTTSYTLTGTDTNGCAINKTFSITINPSPTVTIMGNNYQTVCSGQPISNINFSVTPFNTCSWSNNNAAIGLSNTGTTSSGNINGFNAAVVSSQQISTIYISVNTNNACPTARVNQPYTITVNPLPTVSFSLTQDAAPHTWDAYPTYSSNTQSAIWYWGDGDSTISLYPSHIYAAPNNYNVCVTAIDTAGCSANYCINDSLYRMTNNTIVTINIINTTSGIQNYAQQNINLYPNPTKGIFTVDVSGNQKQQLQILDISGKQILQQTITGKTTFDVSSLDNGVYFVYLKNNTGISTQKLVVQH